MAFVLHQTWDAGAVLPGRSAGSLSAAIPPGLGFYSRRAAATLLSVVVHILLIWVLLNRLAGAGGPDAARDLADPPMTLIDLGGMASPAEGRTQPAPVPRPAASAAAVVDVTAATELPTPEWTVSRLSGAPVQAAPAESGGSAGAGGGHGGQGVYDPYAGASPQLRDAGAADDARSVFGRVLGFFGFDGNGGGLALDEATLEMVRRSVAQALPGQAGTAEMVVRVSPTGVVLEADARGGSVPALVRSALARALVGKRLYRGTAESAKTLALPVLRFG